MRPKLIYCGGGNQRFAKIAVKAGMKYGARLPDTIYGPLFFADQDWKRPNRESYMDALKVHKPTMATVMDLERKDQFSSVMEWAEEASQYVDYVLIVPKIRGVIKKIPRRIGGKDIFLAYSIKTGYGKTDVSLEEFAGWPVHLLGGKPRDQILTWLTMSSFCDVVSVDGNYFRMKATRFCESWEPPDSWVPDNRETKKDAPYKAFERSVRNIVLFWDQVTSERKVKKITSVRLNNEFKHG